VEKYCRGGQATDDNMVHVCCMVDTQVYKHEHTNSMSYLLLFPCNNGCTNVSQCYVTGTLPVLLFLAIVMNPEDNTMND